MINTRDSKISDGKSDIKITMHIAKTTSKKHETCGPTCGALGKASSAESSDSSAAASAGGISVSDAELLSSSSP